MGACDFCVTATGKSAREAFRAAVDDARHENGHGGYTGTIAEKGDFRVVSPPSREKAKELVLKSVEWMLGNAKKERHAAAVDRERAAGLRAGTVKQATWFNGKPDSYDTPEGHEKRATEHDAEAEKIEAKAKDLKKAVFGNTKPIPTALCANSYVDELMANDSGPGMDKWGPAGCLVLREPDAIKPMGKATALKRATEKWGGEGKTVSIEVKRSEGKTTAMVMVKTTPKPSYGYSYGYGSSGHTTCAASATADDADLARGALFAESGKYIFFGLASS